MMLTFHELGQGIASSGPTWATKQDCVKKRKGREEGKGKKGNERKGKEKGEEWREVTGGEGDTKIHKARIVSNPMCHSFIPSLNQYSSGGCLYPRYSMVPGNSTIKK